VRFAPTTAAKVVVGNVLGIKCNTGHQKKIFNSLFIVRSSKIVMLLNFTRRAYGAYDVTMVWFGEYI